MEFRELTLADMGLIQEYLYRFGENSCQHSFPNLYCLKDKYENKICLQQDVLFIRQGAKDEKEYRSYLMPFGTGNLEKAIEMLLADAHGKGKKAKLHTVTKKSAELLYQMFPDRFTIEENRDYAEYIYTTQKLACLPGKELASKRYDVRTFYRDYGNRTRIYMLTQEFIPEILEFQKEWLKNKCNDKNRILLYSENTAIQRALSHFEALGLSGIVVFVGNEIVGYAYGSTISETTYDVYIEKGRKDVGDIYRILNMELAKRACLKYQYMNREEDLGIHGLRKSKMSYKPDILLKKYIAREGVNCNEKITLGEMQHGEKSE